MRIKKLAAIVLASAMAISMCSCEAKEKPETSGEVSVEAKEEESSFDEAAYLDKITEEMTNHLAALAMDEKFGGLYSNSPEVEDIRKSIAGVKADMTKDYQEMIVGDNVYERYITAMEDDGPSVSELSSEAKEQVNKALGTNIGTMINGQNGVSYVAFSAVYAYSRTYVPEKPIENRVRIIPTDKDVSYYVSFYNSGDGALTVTVSYLFVNEGAFEKFVPFFGDDLKTITR